MIPGLTRSRQTQILMAKWANFCQDCARGVLFADQRVKASKVGFEDAIERPIMLEKPGDLSFEEIENRIKAKLSQVDRNFRDELGRRIHPRL